MRDKNKGRETNKEVAMVQAVAEAGGARDGGRETDLRYILEGEPIWVVKENRTKDES